MAKDQESLEEKFQKFQVHVKQRMDASSTGRSVLSVFKRALQCPHCHQVGLTWEERFSQSRKKPWITCSLCGAELETSERTLFAAFTTGSVFGTLLHLEHGTGFHGVGLFWIVLGAGALLFSRTTLRSTEKQYRTFEAFVALRPLRFIGWMAVILAPLGIILTTLGPK